MLERIKQLKRDEQGATAIEFVMVAPVLFLMIFGILEFALLMATQSALEGAVSKAARAYKAEARSDSTGADAGEIKRLVALYSSGLVKPGWLRVVARPVGSWGNSNGSGGPTQNQIDNTMSGRTGQIMQYRAYYRYRIHTPFLAEFMGGGGHIVSVFASTVVQNEPAIGGGEGV